MKLVPFCFSGSPVVLLKLYYKLITFKQLIYDRGITVDSIDFKYFWKFSLLLHEYYIILHLNTYMSSCRLFV